MWTHLSLVVCYILRLLYLVHEGINSYPPEQNDVHFANDIFRYIFVNEKSCISIQISLKFVPKGQIDNKSALVLYFTATKLSYYDLSV